MFFCWGGLGLAFVLVCCGNGFWIQCYVGFNEFNGLMNSISFGYFPAFSNSYSSCRESVNYMLS